MMRRTTYTAIRNILASLVISLTVISCRTGALINPWAYAPSSSMCVWYPEQSEMCKINNVRLCDSTCLPPEEQMLALGDLFDIGLRNNPKTDEAWERAREQAALYAESLSSYLPSLTFDGQFIGERVGTTFNNVYFVTKQLSYGPEIDLKYLLWDFGERSANAEQYFQALQTANWSCNETIQDVMRHVADAYYNYLYQKSFLQATEADLTNAEESYQAASEKMLSGIFDTTDVMQTKTNYLQKKVRVTSQRAAVENSFVKLLDKLGIPTNVVLRLGDFPEKTPRNSVPDNVDVLIELAKNHRPSIQAARANVLAKKSQLSKTKAQVLPKLQLDARGGQQWYQHGLRDNGNYIVEVDLTFPIFTGFFYMNQIKQSEADLKKSEATLRNNELRVIREVKTYYNDYQMAREQIVDTENYLEAAEIEFRAMFDRYKLGIVDILDLLSSEAFLSDARALYAKAKQSYYSSLINIAFSVGSLHLPDSHQQKNRSDCHENL